MGTNNSKYSNMNFKYPLFHIQTIMQLIDFFKPDNYNLHKFVATIKKPKIIKAIQEPFYFTLIHYLVFSTIWLDFQEVQQLWYALSWLKIIKNNKLCDTVVLAIKNKDKRNKLFTRLQSNSYIDSTSTTLKRSNTISYIKNNDDYYDYDDENEYNERRHSVSRGSNEFSLLFDELNNNIRLFSRTFYFGDITAIELLDKIKDKKDSLDVHKDFDKSYDFLHIEIKKYFQT